MSDLTPKFKPGDIVWTFDNNGVPFHGIVVRLEEFSEDVKVWATWSILGSGELFSWQSVTYTDAEIKLVMATRGRTV